MEFFICIILLVKYLIILLIHKVIIIIKYFYTVSIYVYIFIFMLFSSVLWSRADVTIFSLGH